MSCTKENNTNKIDTTFFDTNTYGWSAEQVLLDIFKMSSTRNYYITKAVTSVLTEIAKKEPDYTFVKTQLEKVIFLDMSDFNENDPIKDIVFELKKLYKTL